MSFSLSFFFSVSEPASFPFRCPIFLSHLPSCHSCHLTTNSVSLLFGNPVFHRPKAPPGSAISEKQRQRYNLKFPLYPLALKLFKWSPNHPRLLLAERLKKDQIPVLLITACVSPCLGPAPGFQIPSRLNPGFVLELQRNNEHVSWHSVGRLICADFISPGPSTRWWCAALRVVQSSGWRSRTGFSGLGDSLKMRPANEKSVQAIICFLVLLDFLCLESKTVLGLILHQRLYVRSTFGLFFFATGSRLSLSLDTVEEWIRRLCCSWGQELESTW